MGKQLSVILTGLSLFMGPFLGLWAGADSGTVPKVTTTRLPSGVVVMW